MKSLLFIAVAIASMYASALGQTPAIEKAPLPQGVLPLKAPNLSKWTVTINDSAAASGKPEEGKAPKAFMSVTKTTPIRVVTLAKGKDDNSVIWCVGDLQIQQNKNTQKPILFSQSSESYISFKLSDFPEMSWVSQKNFVGIQRIEDRAYLVFGDKLRGGNEIIPDQGAPTTLQSDTNSPSEWVAYIDSETKLPVSMRKGTVTYVYKYDQPPTSLLQLPENIKSIIEAEQRRLSDLARRPSPG